MNGTASRLLSVKRSIITAAGLLLLLALWLVFGTFRGAVDGSVDARHSREGEEMRVSVVEMEAEEIVKEIVVHGRTAPARAVNLRAETSGRVVKIGAREGAMVKKGEMILLLDRRDREERLKQAEALVRQREMEYRSAEKLAQKDLGSRLALAQASTQLEGAMADMTRARLDLDNTTINAPFSGVLEKRMLEIGDFADTGETVATFMEMDPILVTGEVSELEVRDIKEGLEGDVRLVNGKTATGRIRYVASRAESSTRTYAVELEMANSGGEIPAGMTADIRLPVKRISAYFTSPSNLSLNDEGVLGVKILSDESIVDFYPAEIVKSSTRGVWLSGLPEKIRLITVGQGFVKAGEKVTGVSPPAGGVAPLQLEERKGLDELPD